MEITYLGHSSFRIKTKKAIIVTDPYNDSYVGFKIPKTTAEIVTVSHQHRDHNFIKGVSGAKAGTEPFIINGPGEYEINQIFILGIGSFHDEVRGEKRGRNTIYLISADDLKVCHLGDLGHALSEKQVEEVNQVDVLFIPVGGIYTIDAKKAVEVINQIEPKIIVPMHYAAPGLSFKLNPLKDFLELMNAERQEQLAKLSVKVEDLPEERKIVVLKKKD
jgi:L-ascorbate metabolism protein UlaG (beta-lactamase superfamily)